MIEIVYTQTFKRWFTRLKDGKAMGIFAQRLERVEQGHFGNARSVGDGVFEMKIRYGPGYRLYFIRRGTGVVVLLCGGIKGTQRRDIERARRMAREWQ